MFLSRISIFLLFLPKEIEMSILSIFEDFHVFFLKIKKKRKPVYCLQYISWSRFFDFIPSGESKFDKEIIESSQISIGVVYGGG